VQIRREARLDLLIRVSIVADSRARAQRLSDLLAEDERIEIVEAAAMAGSSERLLFADVVLAVGLSPEQLPHTSAPVVVLADEAESAPWRESVRAWLPLNALASEIAAALIAAASDLTVLTEAQVSRWLPSTDPHRDQRTSVVEALTPRELQVLRMLADGLGNKEIAGRLGISDHTAKFHVTQILAKLGAATRTEAVTIGIRRGLVPL